MAIFITKVEVDNIDHVEVKENLKFILKKVNNEFGNLYETSCKKCGRPARVEWYQWSEVYKCPLCNQEHTIYDLSKKTPGRYLCPIKNDVFLLDADSKRKDRIVRIEYHCKSCKKQRKEPDEEDILKIENFEKSIQNYLEKLSKTIPQDQILDGNLVRENSLFKKGYLKYIDFFNHRSLIVFASIKKEIDNVKDKQIRMHLNFIFTSSLKWAAPHLCHLRDSIVEGWATHDFRIFHIFLEINPFLTVERRIKTYTAGKKQSSKEIKKSIKLSSEYPQKRQYTLHCGSSTELKFIPDNSIDAVITDPPYGSNVQYCELSNFCAIWIKDELGLESVIDNKNEAISDRHEFEGSKNLEGYKNLLTSIFKECWRVLKKGNPLVMTFHNKDIKVWNTVLESIRDGGFLLSEKNGVIYQPPISAYITTSHQRRNGTILGDQILTFYASDSILSLPSISDIEVQKKVESKIKEIIEDNGGASLSTIYASLIPFLTNQGLLHKIAHNALEPLLNKNYIKHGDKWFVKNQFDELGNIKPLDVIPIERRLSELLKSILKARNKATLEEIYEEVYKLLTNGETPNDKQIISILNEIGIQRKIGGRRPYWELKKQKSLTQFGVLFTSKKLDQLQKNEWHHETIRILCENAIEKGYTFHIGKKESSEFSDLNKISIPMNDGRKFGLVEEVLRIVRQIDVIWLKNSTILSAYEIETTTDINSGINRFRNLFITQPNTVINAYIVVPRDRINEAKEKINSPANKKEKINERVSILVLEDLWSNDKEE